jgi:hypothetical protein
MDVLVLHARKGIPGVMAPILAPILASILAPKMMSWFKDGLDDSVGKLNEETQITCMPDCITCQDGLFSKCQ